MPSCSNRTGIRNCCNQEINSVKTTTVRPDFCRLTGNTVVIWAGGDFLDPSGEVTPAADSIRQPCVSSDAYS